MLSTCFDVEAAVHYERVQREEKLSFLARRFVRQAAGRAWKHDLLRRVHEVRLQGEHLDYCFLVGQVFVVLPFFESQWCRNFRIHCRKAILDVERRRKSALLFALGFWYMAWFQFVWAFEVGVPRAPELFICADFLPSCVLLRAVSVHRTEAEAVQSRWVIDELHLGTALHLLIFRSAATGLPERALQLNALRSFRIACCTQFRLLPFRCSSGLYFAVNILSLIRRGAREEARSVLIILRSLASPYLQLFQLQPDLIDIRFLFELVQELLGEHFLEAGAAMVKTVIAAHPLLLGGGSVQRWSVGCEWIQHAVRRGGRLRLLCYLAGTWLIKLLAAVLHEHVWSSVEAIQRSRSFVFRCLTWSKREANVHAISGLLRHLACEGTIENIIWLRYGPGITLVSIKLRLLQVRRFGEFFIVGGESIRLLRHFEFTEIYN